jgi:hypothetical protein
MLNETSHKNGIALLMRQLLLHENEASSLSHRLCIFHRWQKAMIFTRVIAQELLLKRDIEDFVYNCLTF